MFWQALVVMAAVLMAGATSQAMVVTPLALWVEVDGNSYLWNTTDAPLSFDGYQITSENGTLDPVAWDSINDRLPARVTEVIAGLGAGGLTFGEANPSTTSLAELNIAGAGTLAAGGKFSLGKPFAALPPSVDLGGFWSGPNPRGGVMEIVYVPEPSTWLLGALAALGLVAKRRR